MSRWLMVNGSKQGFSNHFVAKVEIYSNISFIIQMCTICAIIRSVELLFLNLPLTEQIRSKFTFMLICFSVLKVWIKPIQIKVTNPTS